MGNYKGLCPLDCRPYSFTDKGLCVNNHIRYMLARTQSMFKYAGLPETIPARELELMLQCNGNVCITDKPGQLYAFTGGMGGAPDAYYKPTIYTVANSALSFNDSMKIGEECIVIANDSLFTGLLPLMSRYATALTENELSMRLVTINSRQASTISAGDDKTLKAAEKYLKDLEDGKPAAIGEAAFFDGVKVQPYGSSGYTNAIVSLIEHEQYLKASWFNDMGLNANYNMKREAINSNESQLNDDMLLPLIDDMLKQRREGLEKVNAKYGTNITVDFASSWKDNEQELAAEQAAMNAPEKQEEQEGENV